MKNLFSLVFLASYFFLFMFHVLFPSKLCFISICVSSLFVFHQYLRFITIGHSNNLIFLFHNFCFITYCVSYQIVGRYGDKVNFCRMVLDRLTDRQTDIQTDRQKYGQTDNQTSLAASGSLQNVIICSYNINRAILVAPLIWA